jgi:hypothetical protein
MFLSHWSSGLSDDERDPTPGSRRVLAHVVIDPLQRYELRRGSDRRPVGRDGFYDTQPPAFRFLQRLGPEA